MVSGSLCLISFSGLLDRMGPLQAHIERKSAFSFSQKNLRGSSIQGLDVQRESSCARGLNTYSGSIGDHDHYIRTTEPNEMVFEPAGRATQSTRRGLASDPAERATDLAGRASSQLGGRGGGISFHNSSFIVSINFSLLFNFQYLFRYLFAARW